jgi:hypothetical protein
MAKILVSLISDQTAPNVLFIKEKLNDFDKLLFISTQRSERQEGTKKIIESLGIETEKLLLEDPLIVDAFSFDDMEQKLREIVSPEDEFIVNITGGTKIMSLATFEFFTRTNIDSEIFYIAEQGNKYIKLAPGKRRQYTFSQYLNLQEYLTAYGVKVKNHDEINSTCFNQKEVEDFFVKALDFTSEQIQILSSIQKLSNSESKFTRRFKKKIQVSNNDNRWQLDVLRDEDWASYFAKDDEDKEDKKDLEYVCLLQKELISFLHNIQFPFKQENFLLPEERSFLTGGWLEEWAYYKIREVFGIGNDCSGINPKIVKVENGKESEFDVIAITKEGFLYIVECKTTTKENSSSKKPVSKLREILDKLSARTRDIGLRVRPYLVTLDKDIKAEDKDAFERDYKITILDYAILTNPEVLRQKLIS